MSTRRLPYVITEGSRFHLVVRIARAVGVVALVWTLPYLVEPFRLGQITGACIYAIVIVGLNLLSGFGGQISLGHAAFFGIGAYATGVLTTGYDVSPPLSFVVGVAVCFAVGVMVSFPAMRLKGIYLALVTLAVGLIFPSLVTRLDPLTGGSAGLFGVEYAPPDTAYFAGLDGTTFWHYWLVVAALGLSCLAVRNIIRSRFGRGLIALRDNETAAIVMGVDRTAARTLVFGTSAGIAGLAGGLYAVVNGILTPASFSLLLTLYFLAGMVMGGPASFWGPVLGGFLVYFVPVWSADVSSVNSSTNLAGIILGVILIVVTFSLRTGVAGLLRAGGRRLVVVVPTVSGRAAEATTRRSRGSISTPADVTASAIPPPVESSPTTRSRAARTS
jgi:branched-chain amino acid transport system permease protein